MADVKLKNPRKEKEEAQAKAQQELIDARQEAERYRIAYTDGDNVKSLRALIAAAKKAGVLPEGETLPPIKPPAEGINAPLGATAAAKKETVEFEDREITSPDELTQLQDSGKLHGFSGWTMDRKNNITGEMEAVPAKDEKTGQYGFVPGAKAIVRVIPMVLLALACWFGAAQALEIGAHDAGVIGNSHWVVQEDGDIVPLSDSDYDLGASGNEIQAIYADKVYVGGAATQIAVPTTLTTNAVDVANSVWGVSNGLVFEGATANAFELTLAPADVGADLTVTLPASSAAVGVFYTSLTTNSVDAANAVTGTSNGFIAEGATADGFETTLSFADPGADFTLTVPASAAAAAPLYTSLTTNSVDAANSITGTSNGFIAEGATADGFETTITFTDPGADQTVTVPAATGTVALRKVTTTTITPDTTATITVVPGVDVFYTYTIDTDNEDCTLTFSAGGTAGDRATIMFITDAAGSADEVMTFAGANSTGTLTLANVASDRYVVEFISDGTIYNEVSRTAVQTT